MTEIRKQFEMLPEIARIVSCDEIKWCDVYNWYRTDNTDANSIYHVAWLNGAWYAFQEQQKRTNEHGKKLKIFIDELRKTHNDDKDNKIDYWRGFSDCADSSVKVFLRDVGFIE